MEIRGERTTMEAFIKAVADRLEREEEGDTPSSSAISLGLVNMFVLLDRPVGGASKNLRYCSGFV
jgi:hypothetical protein